jgi:hypothetical protein
METLITFTGVTLATLVALFAALAMQSLFLKATLLLMGPAAKGKHAASGRTSRNSRMPVERGARLLAQAYAKAR